MINRAVPQAGTGRKGEYMTEAWKSFWCGPDAEDGVGVVEIILILVVLIALVLIFKTQLTELVNNIFDSINSKSGSIYR